MTHLVYLICLIKAFERADMTVAYPILRGVAPLLAAIVAVAVFDEPVGLLTACGIGLVSAGVLTVGLESTSTGGRSAGRWPPGQPSPSTR